MPATAPTEELAVRHPGLARLVDVMDQLRRGSVWESEQTHASLAEYLVEETYELLEAIDTADREHLREELGDLLLQVVFHCRIAVDDPIAPFDLDDVAESVAAKLVRRSPHVFGGPAPAGVDPASHWETVKAAEKGRRGPLEGIPDALPAMTAIGKIRHRASIAGALEAVAPPGGAEADPTPEETFGDDLLRQVLQAADNGIDADRALRGAVRRARARVELAAALATPERGGGAT